MRRGLEPDPEEKKRFEEWDRQVESRRRQNRKKYSLDAVSRIRGGNPSQAELEQWQNYLRYNDRSIYERQIAILNDAIERTTVNIEELTQRVRFLSDRFNQIGGTDISTAIRRIAEYIGGLEETVERYRADVRYNLEKMSKIKYGPNDMLLYFEDVYFLGQRYFSVIGMVL